jgi:hypothetical protein
MIRAPWSGSARTGWVVVLVLAGMLAFTAFHAAGEPVGGPPKTQVPRDENLLFAGIPWSAPVDSVASMLSTRGYPEAPHSRSPGHLHATGRMFDHLALIEGKLDEEQRLVGWNVRIRHRGEDFEYPAMRKVYDDAVSELIARHGPRRMYREDYQFPYEKGDGRQDNALAAGLAVIRSDWRSRHGETLALQMSRELDVVLVYATPALAELEQRDRSHKARDL